jgi:hypothetical protein
MAALATFLFLGAWNTFLWPLTVNRESSLWVVQVGIASLHGDFSGAWNYILAGCHDCQPADRSSLLVLPEADYRIHQDVRTQVDEPHQ